jgi:hypothetical protein
MLPEFLIHDFFVWCFPHLADNYYVFYDRLYSKWDLIGNCKDSRYECA